MKNIIEKSIKILKNIGVFFMTYIIMYMLCDSIGIMRQPIMLSEYNTRTSELQELKIKVDSISYDSVYDKYKGQITQKEDELKNLKDKKSKLEDEIENLKSKLN